MINPYSALYDAKMDIYRWEEAEKDNITQHKKKPRACGRPCRYSSSGQTVTGDTAPVIINSHKLFCGLEEDIKEGDYLVITLRNNKVVEGKVGECHPYTFQWQCEIKRKDNA